jgi:hypothetical protein
MKRLQLLAALTASFIIAGCDDENPSSKSRYPTVAVFAPSMGDIPVPNDLLYAGTQDATLNVPVADPLNASDPLVALNALDGWSTSAPFVIRFSRDIALGSVVAGASVRLFDVETLITPSFPVGGPVLSINSELTPGVDFTVQHATDYPGTTAIRVVPERALVASTLTQKKTYMVICTKAILDTVGFAVSEDQEYFIATDEVPAFNINGSNARRKIYLV